MKKVGDTMNIVREDALIIIEKSIKAVLPEAAVVKALEKKEYSGKVVVIAIGKAAWNMASATKKTLGDKISMGLVVTKYEHSKGLIEGFDIIEAGHPIPDKNSIKGASRAIELVSNLTEVDHVIFLISGGGSALFEKPMEGVDLEDIMDITNQLLSCGADIVEIDTIRKHLSAGGIVDGATTDKMRAHDILPEVYLDNNDSYNALKASGDLIITGSTGTNVNDLIVLLCK